MIIAETVLLTTLLIVSMLAVGTLLDLRAITRVVRQPGPLATGIAVNIVLVPLVALAAIELFGLPPAAGLALFLAAVASGGGSGPLLAHHARGDLALSASLQGMLALSSVGIVPGWLMLAGPRFPAETALQAPGTVLAAVALFQLAPLVVGVALRWRWLLMADRVHAVPVLRSCSSAPGVRWRGRPGGGVSRPRGRRPDGPHRALPTGPGPPPPENRARRTRRRTVTACIARTQFARSRQSAFG